MALQWVTCAILFPFVIVLIRAELNDNRRSIYRVKPVCSVVVIVLAALSLRMPGSNPAYTAGVLGALALSLGGDLALMFRSKRAFMIGLVLFLLAHVVYAVVFTVPLGYAPVDLWSAAVMLVVSGLVYAYLYPGLGRMKVSVLGYVLVIGFMVHRAAAAFRGEFFSPARAWLVTAGAVLFYVSDLMLAVNKFRRPFRYNRLSLAFYYAGQTCLALSAGMFGK